MAITYLQQPNSNLFVATDTPIIYLFSSNQTTQPNFSFIVETYISGVLMSTDMLFPERANRAHWDASKVTMPNIKTPVRKYGLVELSNLPTLQIKVYERYGSTPVTGIAYTSNSCKLVKAVCDDVQYSEPTSQSWLTVGYPPSYKWLTNAPGRTMYVNRQNPVYGSILNTDPAVVVQAYVYGSLGTVDPPLAVISSTPEPGKDRVDICISIQNIEDAISPLSLSDVVRLEIYMNESESLNYIFVDEDCDERNQLSWMNSLGAFDSFLFSHNHERESAIQTLEYKKQFGNWNQDNAFTFDVSNSGDTPYQKTIRTTGTLYSGPVSEEHQNWMLEIYNSIDVLLHSDGGNQRIIVTDEKGSYMQNRFEDILNFQVSYKKTNFKSLTK
jgi:hypothetical protein